MIYSGAHRAFKILTFLILLLAVPKSGFAGGGPFTWKSNSRDWLILQNIGQLQPSEGKTFTDILFYGRQGNVEIYFRKDRVSFVFLEPVSKPDLNLHVSLDKFASADQSEMRMAEGQEVKYHYARTELIFQDALKSPVVYGNEKSPEVCNIISGGREFRAIPCFNRLIYKNIYPHTDLEFFVKPGGIKYQFIVHPGGNPSAISLKWEGASIPEIQSDGGWNGNNGLGTMAETAPFCYQDKGSVIPSGFQLNTESKTLGFHLAKYNHRCDLVIDPDLKWATYIGGNSLETTSGNPVTDPTTNIYISGTTMSPNAIASSGAWQGTIQGQYSAFLFKFDPFGKRVWSTYFGGTKATYGYGVDINKFGQLFLTGTTFAKNLASGNVYKDSLTGLSDAFIARFDTTGGLKWCSYFGGDDIENARDIHCDKSGNIYICGETKSSNNLSFGPKIHEPAYQGGGDGFLARLDTSGAGIWATYYGGIGMDVFNALDTDPSGNIFAGGTTLSSKGISYGHSNLLTLQGGTDAFIGKFNPDGDIIWGSYAGGPSTETGTGVAADLYGNVYLGGTTNSGAGMGTGTGAWILKLPGKKSAFISKFTGSGTLFWCTYFGGKATEDATRLACDTKGRVAITGLATSDSLATANALHQSRSMNSDDAYLAVFSPVGPLEYCTYLGGEDSEAGKGVAFDANGNLITTGETTSSTGIATNKAWQPDNGGQKDLYLVKISCISMSPVMFTGPQDFCSYPAIATYTSPITTGMTYNWKVTGGHFINGQNTNSVVISWDKIGNGEVWSIQKNQEGCTDSFMLPVLVHMSDTLHSIKGKKYVCHGAQAGFAIDTLKGAKYFWKAPQGKIITGQYSNAIIVSWDSLGPQELTVRQTTATGCVDTISLLVTVGIKDTIPPIKGKNFVCKGIPMAFSVDPLPGAIYTWSTSIGQIISGQGTDSISLLVQKRDSVMLILNVTGRGNCNGSDTFRGICVNPAKLELGPDQLFCPLDSPLPVLKAPPGLISWLWMPGRDTLSFIHITKDTFYTLKATDTIGCILKDSVLFTRRCPPACYMPTAFSPNNDGLNDTLMPVGQDVEDYRIVIINRWGEVVFESTNNKKGWDGNFHNKPAPEGIYRWYLEYRGYDTSHLSWETKQGNIWLKRE